ncbi:D-alanyl-D-alanine carboxypeptidase [Listeria grandensis FSL F6-0971]|uniref:D-alanyl-D-alanine carboxypeptidase n=1 Tax=Listeria grandensis FSL F6-0971 TaxID=1265819 RepID=W7BHM9_9LIST|nr:D-alanyl-D-alanine carboxypeptidase family protein [Listeria grandensis]EUJ22756.1 D-alanyl-D-alanine carboxypeptidase [Listeria grandensis FSL F6-0971]
MRQLKNNLLLINSSHPISKKYVPSSLVAINKEVYLAKSATENIRKLLRTIQVKDEIIPVSGYRSYEEQEQIYQESLLTNGEEYTQKYVAKPGCSEHQAGLAIDVALKKENIDFICPDFAGSPICESFRENMAAYGFILRYPTDKTQLTGIAYEPWHFRYVGFPHSEIMKEREYVLEEYIDYLKNFTSFHEPFHWQDGNRCYYIVTVKMDEWFLGIVEMPCKVVICEMSFSNCEELIITYRTD